MKKRMKSGFKNVQMYELDGMSFSNMDFFKKFIDDDCEVVDVRFYHEFGHWDEDPDMSYISIEWKVKE